MPATDIIFVFPHFDEITGTHVDSFRESLGTGYIRAYLAMQGISSEQYVQFEPRTIPQITSEILAFGSSVVGFSCYDCTFYFCVLIAKAIKAINPKVKTIFGGPAITLSADLIMNKYDCIDICCCGEGEETCYELLQRLQEGRLWNDVAGISFRSINRIVRTIEREMKYGTESDHLLDIFPSPYLTGMIPANQYAEENQSEFAMISSRGCLYKCTFCTNTALRKHHVNYHSIDRVIDEIKCISKMIKSTQRVVFYDDAFTLNLPRAKKICKRIIEEKLNAIHFNCVTRVDRFDEELLDLLAQAGFKSIYFGLETASPKILHNIKKVRSTPEINNNYSPEFNFLETMKKNIKSTKAKGLLPVVSVILGLPGETASDAKKTLAFIDKLEISTYMHNFFKIIYGTEDFKNCSNYGIDKKCHPYPLLYWTDYAYDVYAVPPLENSVVHRLLEIRNRIYIMRFLTFFGVRGKVHTDKIDFDTIHILLDVTKDLDKVLSWLANFIQLSSDLYIIEPKWQFSSLELILNSFVENNVPIFSYRRLQKKIYSSDSSINYFLKNLQGASVDDEKYSLKGIPDYCAHILPFNSEVRHSLDLKNESVLKTIDSMADLKQLICQVEGAEIRLMHTDLIAYNYEIVDKCRWAAKQCDVCYLRKLIITNENEVYACYTGQAIGSVGDDYLTLAKRIKSIKSSVLERRGCHACSVSEHCPQCLFLPSYMSEWDYCQTMKTSVKIRIAVALPSLVHELFLQQPFKMEQSTYVNIAWLDERILAGNIFKNSPIVVSPCQLLKVESGEGCYLFCIEKSNFTPMDTHLAYIWDLLSNAAGDWEELKRLASCQTASHEAELTKQINLLFEHLQRAIGPNLKAKLHFQLAK